MDYNEGPTDISGFDENWRLPRRKYYSDNDDISDDSDNAILSRSEESPINEGVRVQERDDAD